MYKSHHGRLRQQASKRKPGPIRLSPKGSYSGLCWTSYGFDDCRWNARDFVYERFVEAHREVAYVQRGAFGQLPLSVASLNLYESVQLGDILHVSKSQLPFPTKTTDVFPDEPKRTRVVANLSEEPALPVKASPKLIHGRVKLLIMTVLLGS
jgi:hypothetical protein